jgi:hypothetical protein
MSAGNDHVFARWSRRKKAVRDSETSTPEERVADAAAPEGDAEPADRQLAAEPDAVGVDTPEPAEPLPRLEDLTAESDLSAFLREGVPKALKSAALRKMWSLDPAIRDYIGPSEYAWDFNQPGSMAGFGPLHDAGQSVADFLSTMSGGARAGFAKAIAVPETSPPLQVADAASPEQEAYPSPDGLADAVSPEESIEPPHVPTSRQSPSPDRVTAAAEPAEPENPAESPRSPARPRHGRAIPR